VVYPEWWEEPEGAPAQRAAAPRPRRPAEGTAEKKRGKATAQIGLFEEGTPARPGGAGAWISALFASATYEVQKRLAGRVLPSEEVVRRFLEALDGRGGKLTREALARHLGLPPFRIGGFVAAMQRLLNVDGYPVLVLDEASSTVELNVNLLRAQFELRGY
jgi:hypothetical protein